jgi:AraC-like DNA-binding protein
MLGFLGFSYQEPVIPSVSQVGVVQLISQHAALAIQMSRFAEMRSKNEQMKSPAETTLVYSNSIFARQVASCVEVHFSKGDARTLTTQKLASHLGYSPRHFHDLFRKSFGCTPHDFVLSKRLDLALSLLRKGHPVSWVANESGFADQSHLAKRFKERFGSLPSQVGRVAGSQE